MNMPAPIGVLVVEDDKITAKAHAKFVERTEGFALIGVARTATQAMNALVGELPGLDPDRIGLVLLDMNLPDGHGIDICRAIRSRRIDVDIMAVTAARDLQIVQEALSLGVVNYLIKPFTYPAFKSKLTSYSSYRQTLGADADGEFTQAMVDQAIAAMRSNPKADNGKGLAQPTLEAIMATLKLRDAMSAAELAEEIGVSRVTARRYLENLADSGQLERVPRYGTTGRPVLEYRIIDEH